MKKIILLAFTFLISAKGFGDQVKCDSDLNIQNLNCNIDKLKIIAEIERKNYFELAKKNDPDASRKSGLKLQEILSKIRSCDPTIKCEKILKPVELKLGHGWREEQVLQAISYGNQCKLRSSFINLKNRSSLVRGRIPNPNKLLSSQNLFFLITKTCADNPGLRLEEI